MHARVRRRWATGGSDAYENLAAGIAATSDVTLYWPGVVTNEDTWADSGSGSSGEFAYTAPTRLHYVKIDLGATYTVDKLKIWHYAADGRTFHHVKAQVSADGATWTTVFDSDVSGEYPETAAGKTHSFTPQPVRYVREHLNGSTANSGNHWVEIEVWGTRTTQFVGDYLTRAHAPAWVSCLFGRSAPMIQPGCVHASVCRTETAVGYCQPRATRPAPALAWRPAQPATSTTASTTT